MDENQSPEVIHSYRPLTASSMNHTSFANVFGPISFTQMRLLSNLIHSETKQKPEKVEEPSETEKKDEKLQKFLMKPTTKIQDASQENIEVQRAERSEFIQTMTLATIQDENFRP